MVVHSDFERGVRVALRLYRSGRLTDRQFCATVGVLADHDDETVSLGAVLGAGRHEDDSGVDLRDA